MPTDPVRRYLQYHYIAANPYAYASKKQDLTDADDGSAYSRVHKIYHRLFGKMVNIFGYVDVFLIDVETLDIVYSYQKTAEFATNLGNGPYADTNLGQMVRALRKAGDRDDFKVTDFEFYRPNLGQPMAFIGSPVDW